MVKIRKYLICAAIFALATSLQPRMAAAAPYYLTYDDFIKLFVTDGYYFNFDEEGYDITSTGHLHITSIDKTTGVLAGYIFSPSVPPYAAPKGPMPITGKLVINNDVGDYGFSWGIGNFYNITFSFQYYGPCYGLGASYGGAITIRSFGPGLTTEANIAGVYTSSYGGCLVGGVNFASIPFSGRLVKPVPK